MLLARKPLGTVAYMGGVPAVLESFVWSWGQMIQYNQELFVNENEYIHYDRAAISDHAPARNSLVNRFLGDWLIQLDTDHSFDPDIIYRMVRTANEYGVDVLSAVYQMKNSPHIPVLFQWVGTGLQPLGNWPREAKVLQIGSAGAGCLFVRRNVFDKMANAYPAEGAFSHRYPFSEDHSFFLRCKEQNINCYAAMFIHSEHLRVAPTMMSEFNPEGIMLSEPFEVGALK